MQCEQLREMARGLVEQARAVLAAYRSNAELSAVQLTDPAQSMQSFGSPYDEGRWFDLIRFHGMIRRARVRDVDAFCELPLQVQIIEREFSLI